MEIEAKRPIRRWNSFRSRIRSAYWWRAAPDSSARISSIDSWSRATQSSPLTTSSPAARAASSTGSVIPIFSSSTTTSSIRSSSKVTNEHAHTHTHVARKAHCKLNCVYKHSRPNLSLGLAGVAASLHVQSDQDNQDEHDRHYKHARSGSTRQGAPPLLVHVGSLRNATSNRLLICFVFLNWVNIATKWRANKKGDPEVHPQPESYWGNVNPIGPRACYDESKRIGEAMCYAYAKQVANNYWSFLERTFSVIVLFPFIFFCIFCISKEHVQVRVARIFNTYGPRMNLNDGRVVSNFILQSLQGKNLTV